MARPQLSKEEKAALRGQVAGHVTAHRAHQREFRGLQSTTVDLGEEDLPRGSTILAIECKSVVFRFAAPLSRIQLQSCTDVVLDINAPVLTSMVEVWKCSRVEIKIAVLLATIQIDASQQISVKYANKEFFKSLVFAVSSEIKLSFGDNNTALVTGSAQVTDVVEGFDPTSDQAIIHYINDVLSTERLCRFVDSGFAVTEREAKEMRSIKNVRTLTQRITDALAEKHCTWRVTASEFAMQEWRRCLTCNMGESDGCCMACAATCHAGHVLGDVKRTMFYCDCGNDSPHCTSLWADSELTGLKVEAPLPDSFPIAPSLEVVKIRAEFADRAAALPYPTAETAAKYLAFLRLACSFPTRCFFPEADVEELWIAHYAHRDSYVSSCTTLFGNVLIHPLVALKSTSHDPLAHRTLLVTRRLLQGAETKKYLPAVVARSLPSINVELENLLSSQLVEWATADRSLMSALRRKLAIADAQPLSDAAYGRCIEEFAKWKQGEKLSLEQELPWLALVAVAPAVPTDVQRESQQAP